MILILAIPIITALICYGLKDSKHTGYTSLAGSVGVVLAALPLSASYSGHPITILNGVFYMDSLSFYMLSIIVLLGLAASAYSISYIAHEASEGLIDIKGIRRYYALFHLFVFTMILIVVSNNLALMWIAIEATTIVSALMIGLSYRKRHLAIEAAWKYIILCTVGITLALLGVFIAYYASTAVMGPEGGLNWTSLKAVAGSLNPHTMRLAFIFIIVGYGTKAGLAPLHSWLPDAHSQAPSPISALLSGILLNTSFYGVLRFASIVGPSAGWAYTSGLFLLFGTASIVLASVFMLVQDNYKRLLAYSSIEHMGIISLGVGIGGPLGLYGSLLHILNHALSKPLMFFASGKIQARYGTTNIDSVTGVLTTMPFLGAMGFIGALSLAGAPPFNMFISEFAVLSAGAEKGMWWAVGMLLIFIVMVFYSMVSAFGRMLLGKPSVEDGQKITIRYPSSEILSYTVMGLMALLIVVLGMHVPGFVDDIINSCINALGMN